MNWKSVDLLGIFNFISLLSRFDSGRDKEQTEAEKAAKKGRQTQEEAKNDDRPEAVVGRLPRSEYGRELDVERRRTGRWQEGEGKMEEWRKGEWARRTDWW